MNNAPATHTALASDSVTKEEIITVQTIAAYRADFDRKIEEIRNENAERLFCEELHDVDHWYPTVWSEAIFTVSRDGIETDFLNDLMIYGIKGIPFGFFVGGVESFGKDSSFVALTETCYFEEGGAMMPVDEAIALAIRRLSTPPAQSK